MTAILMLLEVVIVIGMLAAACGGCLPAERPQPARHARPRIRHTPTMPNNWSTR